MNYNDILTFLNEYKFFIAITVGVIIIHSPDSDMETDAYVPARHICSHA